MTTSDSNPAAGDALYQDPELVQFYDVENGWMDDTRFCLALAQDRRRVLDLGCGTGLLAAALAEGREVVGVDPAPAMLELARQRPGGQHVTWVDGDARSVRLGQRFDLIVMTGHAFQTLLSDDDQRAACQTIAAHLAPGGLFVFDSRNPAREEWQEWTPDLSQRQIRHDRLGPIMAWNDVVYDAETEVATYGSYYRSQDGRLWQARSRIRFASMSAISDRLAESGLGAIRWMGDWSGKSFADGDPEMIVIGTQSVNDT